MAVTFQRTDDGLEIRQSGYLWTRLLGLPLLAGGLYLLWHLVTGIAGLFVPALGAITIPGLVILPVFVALFGIPGWLLVITRKRTLIDVTQRQVSEIWDHLVYRHRKSHPVPAGAAVRIRVEETQSTGRAGGRTVTLRLVEIAGPAGEAVPLAVFADKEVEEARALGREVAGVLGLGLDEAADPQ